MDTKIIIITILIIYLVVMFRNIYVLFAARKCNNMISKYTSYLIDNNKYSRQIDYYEEMQMSYLKTMFSLWIWKPIDMIKPQYKNLIIKFNKYNKKQIIDVIYDDFE